MNQGTITGAFGGNGYEFAGGMGVDFSRYASYAGNYISNTGIINGGNGINGGTGGDGVYFDGGTLNTAGTIEAGAGGEANTVAGKTGAGGIGVVLTKGAFGINSSTIEGGAGGIGIRVSGRSGQGAAGGDGISLTN